MSEFSRSPHEQSTTQLEYGNTKQSAPDVIENTPKQAPGVDFTGLDLIGAIIAPFAITTAICSFGAAITAKQDEIRSQYDPVANGKRIAAELNIDLNADSAWSKLNAAQTQFYTEGDKLMKSGSELRSILHLGGDFDRGQDLRTKGSEIGKLQEQRRSEQEARDRHDVWYDA